MQAFPSPKNRPGGPRVKKLTIKKMLDFFLFSDIINNVRTNKKRKEEKRYGL